MKSTDRRSPEKQGVADCTWSLAEALQDAGGKVSAEVLDMSLREFIACVAGQNGIRFTFAGPKQEDT